MWTYFDEQPDHEHMKWNEQLYAHVHIIYLFSISCERVYVHSAHLSFSILSLK